MLINSNIFPVITYKRNPNQQNEGSGFKLHSLNKDTVSFKGLSKPSQYETIFEFLSAQILDKKRTTNPSYTSAENIQKGIEEAFTYNSVYNSYSKANPKTIRWKSYVADDVRIYATQKVNEARVERLNEWRKALETPQKLDKLQNNPKLISKLSTDKALSIVIWNAINSELRTNNRHIPVPFDAKALEETIDSFESISRQFRMIQCKNISFIEMYTHNLRANHIEYLWKTMPQNVKFSDDENSVWIKVPSFKHDPINRETNIKSVEILSNKNWCTRSRVDKASAALEDGDFYIMLQRDKNDTWEPVIGMASYKGKIAQIQGPRNNNDIPAKLLPEVKRYIKENGLGLFSEITKEGPAAREQMMIADLKAQSKAKLGKPLDKVIKENDTFRLFQFLADRKIVELEDGSFEIGTYKPVYTKGKSPIPYSYLGINEDKLLENVSVIDGDMHLYNKNSVLQSEISIFPQKLKRVTGNIICTKKQYELFGEEMKKTIEPPSAIRIYEEPTSSFKERRLSEY